MDTNDNMATETSSSPLLSPSPSTSPSQQLTELIQALDQASEMAKQLPAATSTTDHHRRIFSSLHSAQLSLSSFLSLYNHHPADNAVSSAAGGGADEPMMDDDGEEEQNSKDSSMDRVEEKMRESLYIQNKRPKRPLSPSAAAVAERRGLEERESVRVPADFDPMGTRLRNLDLVYQFHG